MNNSLADNNNKTKDLTTQTHSTEPSINILSKLNSIANENFHQIIPPVVCEICYKADNLIICEICKNGYHKKCLDRVFLPEPFICFHCKNQFTEEEISSIINNPYNQQRMQRKNNIVIDSQKLYKEHNTKIKKKYHANIFPTKIIELDEDKSDNNNNDNDIKENSEEGNDNKEINLKKKKINKKIIDSKLVENMDINNKEKKNDNKSVKKENKNKIKKDLDKIIGEGGVGENDIYESSILSKSQDINISQDKSTFKHKKRKKDKDKDNNSFIKNKNKNTSSNINNNFRNNSPNNNTTKDKSINNSIDTKSNKDKNNKDKDELSLQQTQSNKKISKKKNSEIKNEKDQNLLLSLVHIDPQYKRRKIKIGVNRQCNMYEFTDKYENKINFDEEEYERNDLVQVWSVEKNPLTEEELNKYMNTARLFWNYKNKHIEEDLCADFFQECEQKMKNKKIVQKLKSKIMKLIKELKELIKRGIDLNSHYDEMSLRVLHLCKYKTNVALLFLYKGLNPFIEEVEEGFKHDIYFFQDEIYSFINNGDLFDSDN